VRSGRGRAALAGLFIVAATLLVFMVSVAYAEFSLRLQAFLRAVGG